MACSQAILDKLSNYIEHNKIYAPFANELLEVLLSCNLTMKQKLEMTYGWLASRIGCCTKTIQRHINKIISTGILSKRFRFKMSNVYRFGDVAKEQSFLEFLALHFSWFKRYLLRKAQEAAIVALNQRSKGGVLLSNKLSSVQLNPRTNPEEYCQEKVSHPPLSQIGTYEDPPNRMNDMEIADFWDKVF